MVKRALALLVLVSGCLQLSPSLPYQCETDGGCFQAGHVCGGDGLCRPPSGAGGGGGSTGGGAAGAGGGSGGGSAGGMTAGGGGTAGGGTDGGCVPRSCPASPSACGQLDDGCGAMLNCGLRADGGTFACPGLTRCGAGSRENVCSAPQSCTDGWCWENPFPQGNTLRAVWGASSDAVWAVGDTGTLLFFNGQYWKSRQSPVRVNLRAVHGTAANDVWAAGEDGVVLHFDGNGWAAEKAATGTINALAALPNGVVFAGTLDGEVFVRTQGGVWAATPATGFKVVNALRAFSSIDVYAGGGAGVQAARYDGLSWEPLASSVAGDIYALAGTSVGDLLAAGEGCRLSKLVGGAFVPLPTAAACVADMFALTSAFAAGTEAVYSLDGGVGLYAQTTGTTWLGAVALDAGSALLVGSNGAIARVTDGRSLVLDSRGATFDLTSVQPLPPASGLVAGDDGRVLQRQSSGQVGNWSTFNPAGPDRVEGLWADALNNAYAVSRTGIVGRSAGAGFVIAQLGNAPLYAVEHHGGHVYVGGTDGGFGRVPDGMSPAFLEALPVTPSVIHQTLRSLFSNGPSLFAVTEQGTLLSGSGAQFMSTLPLYFDGQLRSISGTQADAGERLITLAGTDGGLFWGADSTSLTAWDAGVHDDLYATWVLDARHAWVVGARGAAWAFDGARWSPMNLPTGKDLLGLRGTSDGGLFVVGQGGTVLVKSP